VDVALSWAETQLRLGNPAELLGPVRDLAAEYPLAEPLTTVLIRALAATGRQAEALHCYATFRSRLIEELGTEPGPPLRDLHQALLRGHVPEPATDREPAVPGSHPTDGPLQPVPAQLPRDIAGFTGRRAELATLDRLLGPPDRGLPARAEETPAVAVTCAVSGTAGVGKTALVVRWAHRVATRFPDGQLYVNLRGFDPGGQVMAPATAVRGFLDALGVPAERIPADLDAQAALYRSLLAGRRMLVVLDNARDAEQVRPLLPGAPGCLAVIASRDQLSGLVALDGAHPLTLDLLSQDEARELLARRLGAGRLAAEPAAVSQIIDHCARLPLALSIVAARAARSGFPLATLAAELAEAGSRLDALSAGGPTIDVRAVFSSSYTALSPAAARQFRLFGLDPGPDISGPAAASLAGRPSSETRRLLAELTRANLLTEHAPGRYTFHDLLRAYAADLSHTHDTDAQRRAALRRLLDHYLHTAHAADRIMNPARDPITLGLVRPSAGANPEHLDGHRDALAWLAAERSTLLATLHRAAETGLDTRAWQLAWAIDTFLYRQGHWHDLTAAWQAALDAADRLGDPPAQAYAHRVLAAAHIRLGRYPDAHTHLLNALDLFAQAGDRVGQAHTHSHLAGVWERQGRSDQALGQAQQALDLYRAAGYRRGQADALNAVGWCHAMLGDHTQALAHCQQALSLLQQLGDRYGQAGTWDSLGYAHHHLNHHTEAADCYRHALDLFRDVGDRYYEADTLIHLGDTHHAAGQPAAARTAWRQGLALLTDLGHADADTVRAKLRNLEPVVNPL
jgi:tetratricopeptide (TPR) repeat protein